MKDFIKNNFVTIVLIIVLLVFFRGCSDSMKISKLKNSVTETQLTLNEIKEQSLDPETMLLLIDVKLNNIESWMNTIGTYKDINEKERLLNEIKLLKSQLETLKEKIKSLEKDNKK